MKIDFSHPAMQPFIMIAATKLSEFLIGPPPNRKDPEEEMLGAMREYMERLDKLIAQRQAPGQVMIQAPGEAPSTVFSPPEDAQAPPPEGAKRPSAGAPYSQYAPFLKPDTSCVACARGHITMSEAMLEKAVESGAAAGVVSADPESAYAKARNGLTRAAGMLHESLRFARRDGMDHPEVQKRLEPAKKLIVELERDVLSPESLAELPEDLRQRCDAIQDQMRALRQLSLNQVESVEHLNQAAAEAGNLAGFLWGSRLFRIADEEIQSLLDFDWSPEALANAPESERVVVEEVVPVVQGIQAKLRSVPPPEEIAVLTGQLKRVREYIEEKAKPLRYRVEVGEDGQLLSRLEAAG